MMKTIVVVIALCFTSALRAHVALDHAEPAVGSTPDKPPTELKIWFDGPVGADKSKIEITDENNQSVASGKLHADQKDNTELIIPLAATRGKITVKWQAYCPDCDHTTRGTFTFTMKP